MVGVPGRSRACLTCKKRRIACDLQGPVCGPCVKSKRKCDFCQKHIFVINDEGSHETIYRKQPGEPKRSPYITRPCRDTTGPGNLNQADCVTTWEVIPRPIGTLTALKQQLLGSAFSSGTLQSQDQYTRRPWTLALTGFADSIHALNAGPLASYALWVGRQSQEPYLIEASRRLYVQGLKEVQEAVNDTASALRDETFGSCLALIVYEALECPDAGPNGYSSHVDGCSMLVKMRGASTHQDGIAHNLFRAFRYVAILKALENHRPTFLSSPAWTTLPWQIHHKTMYDRLLDHLAGAPDVLQKGDQLGQTPPHLFLPALVEMIEEVRAADSRLQAYYAKLSACSTAPLYWEVPAAVTMLDVSNSHDYGNSDCNDTLVSDRDVRVALRFHDLEMARILTLYWAMLSLVWSGLTDLYSTVEALSSNNLIGSQMEQVLGHIALEPKDWLEPARRVCQSVEFCSSSEGSPGVGSLLIAAPLDIVIDVMKRRSGCNAEYQSAVKARKEISRKHLRVLQFSGNSELTV